MSYKILEVEITQPLPTLTLSEQETGIALIVRRKNRPIGFLMKSVAAADSILPEQLAQWMSDSLRVKLLQEMMREALSPPRRETEKFPSLTVAICTKDRPDNLARCLQSLVPLQQANTTARFEILVIDNAPSDQQTHTLVASLPSVRYVQEPKPGLDFARNRAIQAATGEWLAFIDDDVVVDRHWFDGLMEAWHENPDAAAFTGLVLPYELETEAQILFERRGGFRRGFEKIRYSTVMPNDAANLYPCGTGIFGVGCNMAFRRDRLLQIGGFDEALDTGAPLPGGGDHDIFYQVIRAGYPLVYEPRYLVFHQHRREYGKLRHQYWTWGLSLMAFVVKAYQSDPPQRMKWIRLISWWFKDQSRQLLKSLIGRHVLPPDLIWIELWGAVIGLLGEYPRSVRRTAQIRRKFS